MTWIEATVLAVALVIAFWVVLILLAKRLPPGPMRDLVAFLPACVTLIRTLRHDPDVPRRAKLALGFAALWVLSPIDLIPEFLPVIGALDDVIVVALALRYAARQVPVEVLVAAWPDDDASLLLRAVGKR